MLDAAITSAVETGRLRYRKDIICLQAEGMPAGVLADDGELMMPMAAPSPAALLPQNLAQAWSDGTVTAESLYRALAEQAGGAIPWAPIRQAIGDAERLGLLAVAEGQWPVDRGMAGSVTFRAVDNAKQALPEPGYTATRPALAGAMRLQANEIQDLADEIPTLMQVSEGLALEFTVEIRLGEGVEPNAEALAKVNAELAKIKDGWRIA